MRSELNFPEMLLAEHMAEGFEYWTEFFYGILLSLLGSDKVFQRDGFLKFSPRENFNMNLKNE